MRKSEKKTNPPVQKQQSEQQQQPTSATASSVPEQQQPPTNSTSFFDLPSDVFQQICQHSINMSVNPQQQVQTLSLVARRMRDETTQVLNTSYKNLIITLIRDVLYLPLEYSDIQDMVGLLTPNQVKQLATILVHAGVAYLMTTYELPHDVKQQYIDMLFSNPFIEVDRDCFYARDIKSKSFGSTEQNQHYNNVVTAIAKSDPIVRNLPLCQLLEISSWLSSITNPATMDLATNLEYHIGRLLNLLQQQPHYLKSMVVPLLKIRALLKNTVATDNDGKSIEIIEKINACINPVLPENFKIEAIDEKRLDVLKIDYMLPCNNLFNAILKLLTLPKAETLWFDGIIAKHTAIMPAILRTRAGLELLNSLTTLSQDNVIAFCVFFENFTNASPLLLPQAENLIHFIKFYITRYRHSPNLKNSKHLFSLSLGCLYNFVTTFPDASEKMLDNFRSTLSTKEHPYLGLVNLTSLQTLLSQPSRLNITFDRLIQELKTYSPPEGYKPPDIDALDFKKDIESNASQFHFKIIFEHFGLITAINYLGDPYIINADYSKSTETILSTTCQNLSVKQLQDFYTEINPPASSCKLFPQLGFLHCFNKLRLIFDNDPETFRSTLGSLLNLLSDYHMSLPPSTRTRHLKQLQQTIENIKTPQFPYNDFNDLAIVQKNLFDKTYPIDLLKASELALEPNITEFTVFMLKNFPSKILQGILNYRQVKALLNLDNPNEILPSLKELYFLFQTRQADGKTWLSYILEFDLIVLVKYLADYRNRDKTLSTPASHDELLKTLEELYSEAPSQQLHYENDDNDFKLDQQLSVSNISLDIGLHFLFLNNPKVGDIAKIIFNGMAVLCQMKFREIRKTLIGKNSLGVYCLIGQIGIFQGNITEKMLKNLTFLLQSFSLLDLIVNNQGSGLDTEQLKAQKFFHFLAEIEPEELCSPDLTIKGLLERINQTKLEQEPEHAVAVMKK